MAIRIGLIGLGIHGTRYANHILSDLPGLELTAASRKNTELGKQFCKEHGIEYFEDYRRLIDSPNVDAVIDVTPPCNHLESALRALKAGKPALVEKPVVRNLSEAIQLCDAVEKYSGFFMLAQTLRYCGALKAVSENLNRAGRIKLVRIAQRLPTREVAWEKDLEQAGGGSVLLTGVHLFDAVRWVLGEEVESAWCRTEQVYYPESEDFFVAVFKLSPSGATCVAEVSKYTDSRANLLDVVGYDSQLWCDYRNDELFHITGEDWKPLEISERQVPTVKATLEDFARCVTNGLPSPITAVDGLRTLEIVDACYRSAKSGKEERVRRSP